MKRTLAAIALMIGLSLGAHAQSAFVSNQFFSSTAVAAAMAAQNETGQNVSVHTVVWTVTGSVSGCTLQLETASTTSFSLMSGSVAQTCTSSGSYTFSGVSANFVRVNLTTYTTSTGSLSINYYGYQPNPVSAGAMITSCGVATTLVACANTVSQATRIVYGTCTAASATTCVVSGIAPAFTGTTTYSCSVTDQTTAANNALKVANTSTTSFTITSTSSSDIFSYVCVGT